LNSGNFKLGDFVVVAELSFWCFISLMYC
jgi:hypothetical protein